MKDKQVDFIFSLSSHFALWSLLLMTSIMSLNTNIRRILRAPSQMRLLVSLALNLWRANKVTVSQDNVSNEN